MDEQAYLESEASTELLKRASVIGGTALAVFRYDDSEESYQVAGCGTCAAACSYVSNTPWGEQTCRKSREAAATASIRRNTPVPFICHMGFSAVAVNAISGSSNWAIILGPYYPDSIPVSVDHEALDGLRALVRQELNSLPFSLDDIPHVNAQAIPVLAEWTRDALTTQYIQSSPSDTDLNHTDTESPKGTAASRRSYTDGGTPDATALLTALIANETKRAGRIIDAWMAEPARKKKQDHSTRRARCLMLVASILEEAESSGIDTTSCWERIAGLTEILCNDDDTAAWRRGVMYTLKPLRRTSPRNNTPIQDFAKLDTLLDQHLVDGITLQEAAHQLNQNPTTLTKRLQRQFGVSYSGYMGRLRVDRAKHLFLSTELTVASVGKRVGLKDPSNFSKLFKKHTGKSPGAYRNQVRQKSKKAGSKHD